MKQFHTMLLIIVLILSSWSAVKGLEDDRNDLCRVWNVWNANKSECECSEVQLHRLIIECKGDHTKIEYRACATYDINQHTTLVGQCPYHSRQVNLNHKLSSNYWNANINISSIMCDPLNRTGVLCSLCKPGLGPTLLNYSYPCVQCTTYGWVMYIAAAFLPATLFFTAIAIFHIDVTSPSLSYAILHSHIMLILFQQNPNILHSIKHYGNSYITVPAFTIVVTYYGIWNLDFFRLLLPSFCGSSEMSMLSVLALEYVVAVYPLIFTAIVYTVIELHARGCKLLNILWRPFNRVFYHFRKFFDIRGSVINAFATFFCLSYAKILGTSFKILMDTKIYSSVPGTTFRNKAFLYFNSSTPYTATGNIPYFVLAVAMPILFCILPLVTLLLFHTKACKCLHKYKLLCEVVKIYQKHFKDGTSGTKDYRSFSALYFGFQVLYVLAFASTQYTFHAHWMLSLITCLLICYVKPYNSNKYNRLDGFWFALLASFVVAFQYLTHNIQVSNVMNPIITTAGLLFPFIYAVSSVLFYLAKTIKSSCCKRFLPTTSICPCHCHRKKSVDSTEEPLPDRLQDFAEYQPLL